jgi:hypothetical protein
MRLLGGEELREDLRLAVTHCDRGSEETRGWIFFVGLIDRPDEQLVLSAS